MPPTNRYLDPAEPHENQAYYPLDVTSCRNCRLMSLTHVVDPGELYSNYPNGTSDSVTITRHIRQVGDLCRQNWRCGPATAWWRWEAMPEQQSISKEAGMRVVGVDPARNLAAIANQNGVETLPEFFTADVAERMVRCHGSARLILGRHVFAHMDDPRRRGTRGADAAG